MGIDAARCYRCGKIFNTNSKPRWVRNRIGHVLGAAHASCLTALRHEHIHEVRSAEYSLEGAQFEAWHDAHYDVRQISMTELLASILIGGHPPTEGLTERQQSLVRHWLKPGNVHEGAAIAAWGRYRELVDEYAAWRQREGLA